MMISEWLEYANAQLANAGVDTPGLDAQMILAHHLGVSRSWVLAHMLDEVNLKNENLLLYLQKRVDRVPLAYILGWREFYGRRFIIEPGVLIPRQETEILVDAAKECFQMKPDADVLDIGTGSGCIAITLKLECPKIRITGIDLSEIALKIASNNAKHLDATVSFLNSDRFEELPKTQQFDLIVSNPPYIAESHPLQPEVIEYEPMEALLAGPEGLNFYEYLVKEAKNHLNHGGKILMELGYDQHDKVLDIFQQNRWKHFKSWKDFSGVWRVIGFES